MNYESTQTLLYLNGLRKCLIAYYSENSFTMRLQISSRRLRLGRTKRSMKHLVISGSCLAEYSTTGLLTLYSSDKFAKPANPIATQVLKCIHPQFKSVLYNLCCFKLDSSVWHTWGDAKNASHPCEAGPNMKIEVLRVCDANSKHDDY